MVGSFSKGQENRANPVPAGKQVSPAGERVEKQTAQSVVIALRPAAGIQRKLRVFFPQVIFNAVA